MAWGLVNYLDRHRGVAAVILAAELGAYARQHGRETDEDGRERWRQGWEVPYEVQLSALQHSHRHPLVSVSVY